jgi:hypothetical protein
MALETSQNAQMIEASDSIVVLVERNVSREKEFLARLVIDHIRKISN